MSRTVTAALATHLSGRSHTRCNMLLLDLRDGSQIGITDHDKDLAFDLGDGEITYDSGTGILSSDIALSCGLDADNFEVTGPIAEIVTLEGILGGRFDRAGVRLFQVNWKDLTQGAIKILKGTVTEPRVEGGKFVFEVRSDKDHYNQVVGRTITNNCDADFADGIRCFATATEVTGTVTTATDGMRITVSYTGSYADDFFNKGTVIGLTGGNAGTVMEIEDWNDLGDGTATVTLFAPLAGLPAAGDTFTIRNGCGKSRADCMAHNAILWFRGYPEVPGRKALMPAIPGA